MFIQNDERFGAPGNKHDMPTIAILSEDSLGSKLLDLSEDSLGSKLLDLSARLEACDPFACLPVRVI
jgi:hypothetical protein